MATGVDEDDKKPRNLTDQVVRLLDDDAIPMPDRLRLIIEYVLHRDGIFQTDVEKLLAHAQLPAQDFEIIQNLDLLGAQVFRQVKDQKPSSVPLVPRKPPTAIKQEDLSISRFEPVVKAVLEEQLKGTLDPAIFPYTKPLLDASDAANNRVNMSQSSLRSAKPTWARTRPSAMEPRQRVIVFMAGGATYSESRACYEISREFSKDVYMATSHMQTPNLFLRQLGDLSVDKRRLDLPIDRPARKAPAHVFEKEPAGLQKVDHPPASGLAPMAKDSGNRNGPQQNSNRSAAGYSLSPAVPPPPTNVSVQAPNKITKEPKEKKRNFFKF